MFTVRDDETEPQQEQQLEKQQHSGKSSTKSDLHDFNLICLKENNRLRSLHNCPKLKLSRKLMKSAKIHSEYLREQRQLQHRPDFKCGQNMALIIGQQEFKVAGLNAVQAWYKQSENYDYKEHSQESRGYFTQMIWKQTSKVGFGFTFAETGNIVFVVGHYSPPGNKSGEYQVNVPPQVANELVIKSHRSKVTHTQPKHPKNNCPSGQCVII
ncbi:unnamed protein product [Heterobilharzia americana]|nr:unnamed protein product [Heterobilharzia americana]